LSTPATPKRKSDDIQNDTPAAPKKKKKRSRRVPQTQSPSPAVARQDANSPSNSSLSGYLMKRLAARDQQVDYLENERAVLKEQASFYQKESDVLREQGVGWKRELCESKKQVLHLHALLASKVESLASKVELLRLEVDLRRAMEAQLAVLNAAQDRLTAESEESVEALNVERSLVASLQLELETTIPVPETLDDLARSVEQLVHCTTSKRSHLSTKVKVICESLLSSVFDGRCRAYLVSKASGLVKSENPYRSAIQIAKVIDLSGSLLNLSGYNALRKGVEGDGDGKIERNGGWLVSKYHLMKAMKAVEVGAQAVIPFVPTVASENDDGIDGVQFDYGKLLAFLIRLYGLDAVARDPNQPPVEFSITLDGLTCRETSLTSPLESK
jgi:hypothetical protein